MPILEYISNWVPPTYIQGTIEKCIIINNKWIIACIRFYGIAVLLIEKNELLLEYSLKTNGGENIIPSFDEKHVYVSDGY